MHIIHQGSASITSVTLLISGSEHARAVQDARPVGHHWFRRGIEVGIGHGLRHTSRSGGSTSLYSMRSYLALSPHFISTSQSPSGARSRRWINVSTLGPYQRASRSLSVHVRQTRSRGASKTRSKNIGQCITYCRLPSWFCPVSGLPARCRVDRSWTPRTA